MAGNYMDAPGHRLAYDRDGSVGIGISNTGLLTALTQTQLQQMNSEAESGMTPPASSLQVAIIFPSAIDLAAAFIALGSSVGVTVWTSKDSTTGLDGTWTQRVASATYLKDVKPNYRVATSVIYFPGGVDSQDIIGIKIIGASSLPTVRAFHVYGSPASSATPDRLQLWHPTTNARVDPDYFDWGDVPRSSSADRSFRVKNMSGTLTANDIEVYIEALTPGSPSVNGMHTLSTNGGSTFLTSATIDELSPGEISDVLILRRVIPTDAQVGVWSSRIGADVGSWT